MTIHLDPAEARRAHRLAKADDELCGFFSANVGLSGHGFEGGNSGGAFNSHNAHEGRLRAMAWLSGHTGARDWFDRVAATIAALSAEHRHIVAAVYVPHAAPTWLQDKLSPPWGSGSFVQLGVSLPRAAAAAVDRNEETFEDVEPVSSSDLRSKSYAALPRLGVVRRAPQGARTVLDWIAGQGIGGCEALLKHLREDCEKLRMPALEAYEKLRGDRVKAEQGADRARRKAFEEKNAKYYTDLVGKKAAKERARFARRTKAA